MKKSEINPERRNFLRMLGLAGAGTVIAAAAAPVMFSERFSPSLHQARQTRTMMSTYVQLTVLDESKAKAEDAINGAFAEMARLEEMLTRFSASSPLAVLNDTGRLTGAPTELMQVLNASAQLYALSGKHFDITILPLLNTVESTMRAGVSLDSHNLAEASELVGFGKMSLAGNSVNFTRPGMAVTLDGIAKGYIVDRAVEGLAAAGIKHALVNAGGDMRALNGKQGGQGWQILVQDPANANGHLAQLELNNRAVATSGNYEAYFDKAKLFGHIVNPITPGLAAKNASASIMAPTCMQADALATAAFAMELNAALALAKAKPELGALLVEQNGSQHSLRFS